MNDLNEMDQDTLMQLLALNQASESDDDFDDENFDFAEDDDDEESFVESDDDDDFESTEWEENSPVFADSADLGERSRRRRRRSFRKRRYKRARAPKLRTVKGSKSTTLKSANGQRMRVQFGKSYATTVEVNKLIKSTEAKFAAAMKERKANHSLLTKQIASATSNIDGKIDTVNKKVKSLEGKAQTSSLMGLLSGPPKIKSIQIDGVTKDLADSKIEFEPADMTIPLIMGMSGGSGGSDNNNMMMALLLSQKKS